MHFRARGWIRWTPRTGRSGETWPFTGSPFPSALDARFLGQGKHPVSGKTVATFRADTEIDRQDFGVTFRAPLESGGTYVGDRVAISLVIAAVRQD